MSAQAGNQVYRQTGNPIILFMANEMFGRACSQEKNLTKYNKKPVSVTNVRKTCVQLIWYS